MATALPASSAAPPVRLQRLDAHNDSQLYQRRRTSLMERDSGRLGVGDWTSEISDERLSMSSSAAVATSGADASTGLAGDFGAWLCQHCGEAFQRTEPVFRTNGDAWHERCFLCAQCFQPFPDGKFYEFDGRKFCEHDFTELFKPRCAKCGIYIVGRVIRALQASWHPGCFTCQACDRALTDAFVKSLGRPLCRGCASAERRTAANATRAFVCSRCGDTVPEGQLLRHRGDNYHAYHFSCSHCRTELTADAREKDGQLLCVRCFDRLGVPVCARCRRPIDQERVVHAAGKAWHVEHFVCAACEKPFNGTRHFERRGLAYCETHYQQLFGRVCFQCNDTIRDQCVQACTKSWCSDHFRCSVCDRLITQRSKFYEYDLKPVCKSCYQRFPTELRRRLAKIHKQIR